MTLSDLINNLPNGFHDAVMKSVMLDYSKHEARIDLMIWVGDLDAQDEKAREAYEEAELKLKGLFAWVMEPPGFNYTPVKHEDLMIDVGSFDSLPDEPPVEVPKGSFGNWIYVTQWNAFIFCVAKEAKLEWKNRIYAEK